MIGGVEHMNKDQKIDWRDFVASTIDRSVVLREDNMRRAFEHFRHSHAEYITIDDLADIFGSKVHAHEVMDMLDIEHEGKVSYENFRLAIVESMDNDASDDDQDAQIDHEIIS
jgi:calcium-dependent protein kinase